MDGSKNAEGGGFAARNPVLLPLNASFAKVAAKHMGVGERSRRCDVAAYPDVNF
jgi:hypothetical protein